MSVIIIGCGISGIQYGYYLEKYKINYVIIEKENCIGNMILKKNIIDDSYFYQSDDEDNYSLLCDDIETLNFKKKLNQELSDVKNLNILYVEYLNKFIKKYNLNILFNTKVNKISIEKNQFTLFTNKKNFKAIKIIIATGKNKINIPKNLYYNGKSLINHIINCDNIELIKINSKNIIIIGNENDVMLKIKLLLANSNKIIILNSNTNEKKLNLIRNHKISIINFDLNEIKIIEKYNKYYILNTNELLNLCDIEHFDNIYLNTELKFNNDIFDEQTINITYDKSSIPYINQKYTLENNDNIIFIGSLLNIKTMTYRYLIKKLFMEHFFIDVNNDYTFEINNKSLFAHKMNQFIKHRLIEYNDLWYSCGLIGDLFYFDYPSQTVKYYKNYIVSKKIYNFIDTDKIFIINIERSDNIKINLKIYKKILNYFVFDSNYLIYQNQMRNFNIDKNINIMINVFLSIINT